jgi:hypothetical protein
MTRARSWDEVLAQMMAELRGGEPRAEAYWAQQLAFGPVLVHALALRARAHGISEADAPSLARVLELAAAGLGPLPEEGRDPAALAILARRQAAALATGRRRQLAGLAARHGLTLEVAAGPVPARMLRPYPLLGWRPSS